jgi:hypothetical protein
MSSSASVQEPLARQVTVRWRVRERVLAHPLLSVAAVATLLHVLSVVLLGPLQEGVAVPDEQQYLDLAASVASGRGAEAWMPGYGQSLYDSTLTFLWPLTLLTRLFGEHQLNGQLIAAVCGTGTAVLACRLAMEAASRTTALLAGLLVAALPSQLYWSSVSLRESMVWFCLVGLALLVALAGREGSTWRLALLGLTAAAVLVGLSHLRAQTALVAAVALAGTALCFRSPHRWLVPLGAVTIAVFAPLVGGLGPGGLAVVERALPQIAVIRGNLSLGASTSIVDAVPLAPPATSPPAASARPSSAATDRPGARPTSPAAPGTTSAPVATLPPVVTPAPTTVPEDTVVITGADGQSYRVEDTGGVSVGNLPSGLVAVALRPFPWEPATSRAMSLARLELLAWAPLYLLALIGILTGWRHRRALAFPFAAGAGILLLAAMTQGNLGTAFRHRGQILWILAVLAAVGVDHLRKRLQSR